MAKQRILITVKTYPTISTKYKELVCTAGFLEDGSMIRLYPIPFRRLPYEQWYKKYDWIEADIERNTTDFRPESYRVKGDFSIVGKLSTSNKWSSRKKLVLGNVFDNFQDLIKEAKDKDKCTSLAVFKPTSISDFVCEEVKDREWSSNQKSALRQLHLFEQTPSGDQVVKKLPYTFRYVFTDVTGKQRKIMIEDWEVGGLYWKMVRKYNGDEKAAIASVKQKFFDELVSKTDLHFFVGTTKEHHAKNAPNPFLIIGVFYPPIDTQLGLPGF